ncbi:Peptidase M16 family [Gracilaria domingensis]|nr:Peptidase M16 family [Gracilaria domingensis]
MTEASVLQLQNDHHLLEDGIVGSQTWAILCTDSAPSTPDGAVSNDAAPEQAASQLESSSSPDAQPESSASPDAQPESSAAPVASTADVDCSRWTDPTRSQRVSPFETTLSDGMWRAYRGPSTEAACALGAVYAGGTPVRVEARSKRLVRRRREGGRWRRRSRRGGAGGRRGRRGGHGGGAGGRRRRLRAAPARWEGRLRCVCVVDAFGDGKARRAKVEQLISTRDDGQQEAGNKIMTANNLSQAPRRHAPRNLPNHISVLRSKL